MTYVTRSGPLFDARRTDVVRAFLFDSEREVAEEGRDLVIYYGQGSFRYLSGPPTYQWRESVGVSRTFGGFTVTEGVVYGPWLEGVSQRNTRTRFKGYAMFRRAAQVLGGQAHLIAERVLPLYLRRLGGR